MNKRIHKKKAQQNIEEEIIKLTKRKLLEQFVQNVLYGKEAKNGAFGVKWMRGEVEEFTPFCCTHNIEWEIEDDGNTDDKGGKYNANN